MNLELKIPPVVVVAVTMILIYVFSIVDPNGRLNLPYTKYALIILWSIGVIIAFLGVYNFRQHSTTVNPMSPNNASTLVDTGVYSFTRNPMYLGMAFIVFGFAWYHSHYLGFVAVCFFVLYMSKYQIKPEEVALNLVFTSDYQQYCKKVRRWV